MNIPKSPSERIADYRKRHGVRSVDIAGDVFDRLFDLRNEYDLSLNETLRLLLDTFENKNTTID